MLTGFATIADILNQWNELGVFNYILPFLIIFAVVYSILNKSKILGNPSEAGSSAAAANVIVALAIGLISLWFDIVPRFFAALMPGLGVGLSIILAVTILMGFFVTFDNNLWLFAVRL